MPLPIADPVDRRTILLFFEEPASDKFVPYDRYLKQALRPLYHRLHRRQKASGFSVSFRLLVKALVKAGYDVRVNDRVYALAHPHQPVGLVGFPVLLDDWDLPNPAILGPSMFDHPMLRPALMKDPRFRSYVVLADWMRDVFAPVYGSTLVSWHAGIDLDEWPDTAGEAKDIDILVYDKIYRDREVAERWFLAAIEEELAARGLRTARLRYKMYDHAAYRDTLRRSRAMLFLCEHETQGLAYQEALASNVPVLAWDFGMWTDPLWKAFSDRPVPASSVPFFSPECGERFRTVADFGPALSRLLDNLATYRPRDFVARHLSQEASAAIYAEAYFAAAETRPASLDFQQRAPRSPPPPAAPPIRRMASLP